MKIIDRANLFRSRVALISGGNTYTYSWLLDRSAEIAGNLRALRPELKDNCICFLVPPSADYTAVLWGIWRAGAIAVPLCVAHPLAEMGYVVEDSESSLVITHPAFEDFLRPLAREKGFQLLSTDQFVANPGKEALDPGGDYRAMILYTSGTTSKPKGVVFTHANIVSQITTLVDAWRWSAEDHILNVLPLHHVHGIINIMCCALWSGACCEFLPKFEAVEVWDCFRRGEINIFMAVPTIYYKLIDYWESCAEQDMSAYSEAAASMRLMVSGSAALPVAVLEKWRQISGQTLLERYGMTEIGMGLSNPYEGERRPGFVGQPLPGVILKLVDESLMEVDDGPGEILIQGPSVFEEYWRKKEATEQAFTADGWFITGDMAVKENGAYRILGRKSVDIIKSGGYKISALEIEEELRQHPEILDCAVVGLPDEEWGERIAAGLISNNPALDTEEINSWLGNKLAGYKLPRKYMLLDKLPRNVLGKVTKKELVALF